MQEANGQGEKKSETNEGRTWEAWELAGTMMKRMGQMNEASMFTRTHRRSQLLVMRPPSFTPQPSLRTTPEALAISGTPSSTVAKKPTITNGSVVELMG